MLLNIDLNYASNSNVNNANFKAMHQVNNPNMIGTGQSSQLIS